MKRSKRSIALRTVLACMTFTAACPSFALNNDPHIAPGNGTAIAGDQLDQAENGLRLDPVTGDLSYAGEKDYASWDEILKDHPLMFPSETLNTRDPFAALPRSEMPAEFTQKSLGGAVASTLGCVVVSAGTALACGASIYAAYQTAGFTATMIPEGCGQPLIIAGGLCLTALEQWIDLGADEAPAKRHRSLVTAWSQPHNYDNHVRQVTCPGNLHLIDEISWNHHNSTISGIQIGCTNNTSLLSTKIGPDVGTETGSSFLKCGKGRTISRFDVKHSNGRVTGLRPYCGNATGAREWGNPSSGNHFSAAAGSVVTRQCPQDHNAGRLTGIHNTTLNRLDALRPLCH